MLLQFYAQGIVLEELDRNEHYLVQYSRRTDLCDSKWSLFSVTEKVKRCWVVASTNELEKRRLNSMCLGKVRGL